MIEFVRNCGLLLAEGHWLEALAFIIGFGILMDMLMIVLLTIAERRTEMISKVFQFDVAGNPWYCQIITDEAENEIVFNLYGEDGGFVEEFNDLGQMLEYAEGCELNAY